MADAWAQRLLRGALAGVAGGVASATMLWLLVEPALQSAIALEGNDVAAMPDHSDVGGAAHGHDSGEIVSRLQQQIGGTLTVVVVGVLMGVIFAVLYARSRHRLPGTTDLGKSLALGALIFTVVAVLPAFLVPANPPGVGDPDTVTTRTLTYVLAIGLGVLVIGAVFAVNRVLFSRGIPLERVWMATAGVTILLFGAVLALAPSINESVPSAVPASLIWQFRVGSLAQLGSLWLTIGLVHGYLAHKAVARERSEQFSLASG